MSAPNSLHSPSGRIARKVAVLIPKEKRKLIFPAVVEEALRQFAEPIIVSDEDLACGNLDAHLASVKAVITGWKSPVLPLELLTPEGSVAFVSHAAGSVRRLGIQSVLEAGKIRASHSAPIIASAVAEFTLTQILAHLKRVRDFDSGFRNGAAWYDMRENILGHHLGEQDVGLVGLGYVGRLVLDLMRPFGCRVFVYDPFLSPEQAAELGVSLLGLDELFERCSVVSLHAANLPATEEMIKRSHLEVMRTGGLLVNTARAGLIENGALFDVLLKGQIYAAIDTFDTEPPAGSDMTAQMRDELGQLSNVYLSPHVAGHTSESYIRQGLSAVEEVRRFLCGEELIQEILPERAATLA